MCIINPLHRIKQIAAESARLFREDTTFGRTLEDRIESAILDGLDSIFEREIAQTLRRTEEDREAWMKKYISAVAQLNAVKAGLSFDASQDRDLEACARRLYHECATAKKQLATICLDETFPPTSLFDKLTMDRLQAKLTKAEQDLATMTKCRDDAVAAAHLMQEEKK